VDFEAVQAWYSRTGLFASREDVEAELGPPTEGVRWGAEVVERMERVEHSNRHLGVPAAQEWVR
jgi:hypothetical protein